MTQCAMGAIYAVMHVYCTYSRYSHSIVDIQESVNSTSTLTCDYLYSR